MAVCTTGLHLVILGLSCLRFQAYGQDNSTQMLYVVLSVEAGAIRVMMESLASFRMDSPVLVDQLTATTKCMSKNCTCLNGHVNDSSTDSSTSPDTATCQPTTRVTIKGLLFLSNEMYYHSMGDPNSDKSIAVRNSLITKMKPSFSTLPGFDDIQILTFRLGVYVDFVVHINRKMSTQLLQQKAKDVMKDVNGTFTLETIGQVDIQLAELYVPLGSTVRIVCTSHQQENAGQEWTQTTQAPGKEEVLKEITNGTESVIMSDGMKTMLSISHTSAIWTGHITCSFKPLLFDWIIHRATVPLQVALLPNIQIYNKPQFPHCTEGSTVVPVTVHCEFRNSTEQYSGHWIVRGNKSETLERAEYDSDPFEFVVETAVGCLEQDKNKPAKVTCVFKNTKDQTREAMVQINVIFLREPFCRGVDDWPDTKAGYTAKLPCKGQSGVRLRTCTSERTWGEEESQCVNNDLFTIVGKTTIINKGLGSVSKNSHELFTRLATATNVTESINTVSNLNTSINILDNMQKLNHNFGQSTLDNILKSSSNLLNIQEPSVWNPDKSAQAGSNTSMAETYLSSVGRLIRLTSITKPLSKEDSNIQISSCFTKACNVFNVTVSVDMPVQSLVKAAGYKNLIQFLPLKQWNAEPNSIVVTVSVNNSSRSRRDVRAVQDVLIHFQLTSPRPRNHGMHCVAMDADGKWSLDRCTWAGPSNEGSCRCRYSSAYATVLSKNPIDLPALRELTYVGLAFSIASLCTFLMVECLVWKSVVKTNSLYLRHTALVNISASLLVGDCSLLASAFPGMVSDSWCQACVVLQHFFYLAQFCWMFCLSTLLLYQAVFLFEKLGKGRYQGVCYAMGYGVPFMIVTATFVTHNSGAEGMYYDAASCWLTYHGLFKGSFYSFIIPVGIIVFFNLFSMVMVIIRLLNHPKGGGGGVGGTRRAAIHILRSIVVLTPIFGVTWIFGFATLALDLAAGTTALLTYYTFSICNSLQGFFILLAACVGEKMVRDALRKRICPTLPSSSSTSMETYLPGKDN